jgi:hypothetical protein
VRIVGLSATLLSRACSISTAATVLAPSSRNSSVSPKRRPSSS